MPKTREAELWDRRQNERSKAFDLFCMYRDMGPSRSLEKLARSSDETGMSFGNLRLHSKRHDWVKRAEAYDDHRAAQDLKDNEQLIKKFKTQRALEALAIADKAYSSMKDDKTGSKEARKRWELGIDKFMQILGLDKTKVELSGEVKTNDSDKAIHLIEAINATVTPEQRMELSKKLMDIAEGKDED